MTTMKIGTTAVSLQGHTHIAAEITDLNDVVPIIEAGTNVTVDVVDNVYTINSTSSSITVDNAANDRVLTSTGTSTGINAESTFTFDGTIVTIPGTISVSTSNGDLTIAPNATGALKTSTTGDARGDYAVDLQMDRDVDHQVASSSYSAILGGRANKAAGFGSLVIGGNNNYIVAENSVIASGGLGGTFTVTIATPGVFTINSHHLIAGDRIRLKTTGALPTGLSENTTYYVISTGLTTDTFQLSSTFNGSAINTSGSQSGTHYLYVYSEPKTFTVTIANPAVVTSTTHELVAGDKLVLTTTGSLPSSLSSQNFYYVISTGLTSDTFRLSTTSGGSAISTLSQSQSGTHTFYRIPNGTNIIESSKSFIGGGSNQIISSTSVNNTIISGSKNIVSGTANHAVICGGYQNTASANYTTIGGGYQNTVSANFSTVLGGKDNIVSGLESIVGGGNNNNVSSNGSAIVGGKNNTVSNTYAIVGAGLGNTVTCTKGVIGGGENNSIGNQITGCCVIGGGENNSIGTCGPSVIGGGSGNVIANSSDYCVIGGGYSNSISSSVDHAVIGGGESNTSSASHTAICGGFGNVANAQYSAVLGGFEAKTNKYGEISHAAGKFANIGDAQHSNFILRRSTSDATSNQVLFLDGTSLRPTIPAQTGWTFHIKLTAYNTTDNAMAGWLFKGVIRRDNSNSTAIVGTVTSETWSEAAMSTAIASVVADDTNEALEVRVTGIAAKTIRWVAVCDIVQVSFGTI